MDLVHSLKWRIYRLRAIVGREFPLSTITDADASAPYHHSKIPPVLYQTWSTNRLGRTHARQIAAFRRLNPELSFRFYDDDQMSAYMKDRWGDHPIHDIFANARFAQLATDIFRYCILYERGGFYFDISKGLSAPICSLLTPNATGLITYEHREGFIAPPPQNYRRQGFPDNIVAQYGFGFVAKHPILDIMIRNICDYYPALQNRRFVKPKNGILSFTGPGMFTKAVRAHLAGAEDHDLIQAGVDFNGKAIWKLKGAYVRFFSNPPYKYARNEVIVG